MYVLEKHDPDAKISIQDCSHVAKDGEQAELNTSLVWEFSFGETCDRQNHSAKKDCCNSAKDCEHAALVNFNAFNSMRLLTRVT